jgi:cation transport regulator ChaC
MIGERSARRSGIGSALVFGYGSLVALDALTRFLGRDADAAIDAAPAQLHGYIRCWNVAMDNTPIPGYKIYLDERGARPDVAVTFLNVRPRVGHAVNGVVVRVSAAEFERIERRERNYRLVDLSAAIGAFALEADVGEPVFVSVGRGEPVARFAAARRSGRAVVVCAYRAQVERAFRALGDGALAAYRSGTERWRDRCLPLRRVDVPADAPPT